MTTEEEVINKFKLPVRYEAYGQKIFDADNNLMINVRAWGYLQRFYNGVDVQNTMGEMFAKAFNEKYYHSNITHWTPLPERDNASPVRYVTDEEIDEYLQALSTQRPLADNQRVHYEIKIFAKWMRDLIFKNKEG